VFERFTDRARRVVVLAQEESRRLNHNYIGTEHVLLGLISEDEGIAAQVLRDSGLDLDGLRARIEEIIGRGTEPPGHHIPFTPRAKTVLELSLREALQLQHNYIGTEHILLGLIREGQGVAAQVLGQHDVQIEDVRRRVLYKVRGSAEQHTRQPFSVSSPSMLNMLREIQQAMIRIERRLDALGAPRFPADPAPDPDTGPAPAAEPEQDPPESAGPDDTRPTGTGD
jgi:ATP-dependent Clp protease ATP-binding subunit ClpA